MSSGELIRVMVVDDHSIVRAGLKSVLEQSGEFKVVGQAANGEEAVRIAECVTPDIVVMDVIMPGMDGVEACRQIMESSPDTKVIMLTASMEDDAVVEAVAAGATGYLQKETDMERLLETVHGAVQGEFRVPSALVKRVFEGIRNAPDTTVDAAEVAGLTPRERDILVSFARGVPYDVMAETRGIKTVSVRNAVYNIRLKLGIESMQGLVLWAVRNGLLDDFEG